MYWHSVSVLVLGLEKSGASLLQSEADSVKGSGESHSEYHESAEHVLVQHVMLYPNANISTQTSACKLGHNIFHQECLRRLAVLSRSKHSYIIDKDAEHVFIF